MEDLRNFVGKSGPEVVVGRVSQGRPLSYLEENDGRQEVQSLASWV